MDQSTINILIALVAVALTLGGLIYGAFASLRHEMRSERNEMRSEIQAFRTEVKAQFSEVNVRLLALEQGQERLLGFREGFSEALSLSTASKAPSAPDGH